MCVCVCARETRRKQGAVSLKREKRWCADTRQGDETRCCVIKELSDCATTGLLAFSHKRGNMNIYRTGGGGVGGGETGDRERGQAKAGEERP